MSHGSDTGRYDIHDSDMHDTQEREEWDWTDAWDLTTTGIKPIRAKINK